jgi:hypothetical protein
MLSELSKSAVLPCSTSRLLRTQRIGAENREVADASSPELAGY